MFARELQNRILYGAQLLKTNGELKQERDRANNTADDLRLQLYREDLRKAQSAFEAGDVSSYHQILAEHLDSPFHRGQSDVAWHYVWSLGHRRCQEAQLSEGALYSAQLSHDGNKLLICGEDGKLRILNAADLSCNSRMGC